MNVIFQLKKGAGGKPEGTQNFLSNINNTRTRQEQGVENSQNIQEKAGFDHNFNIVLSILNIKNSFDINFF